MGTNGDRKSNRYRQKMPVKLEGGSGVTRDLSVSGVYFQTELPLATGQTIEFTILFENYTLGTPKLMKCKGKIIRVEENGSALGVATQFDSFEFEEPVALAVAV